MMTFTIDGVCISKPKRAVYVKWGVLMDQAEVSIQKFNWDPK